MGHFPAGAGTTLLRHPTHFDWETVHNLKCAAPLEAACACQPGLASGCATSSPNVPAVQRPPRSGFQIGELATKRVRLGRGSTHTDSGARGTESLALSFSSSQKAEGPQPKAACFSSASLSSSARVILWALVLSWPQAASMSRPRG